jgi:hypothetical protein
MKTVTELAPLAIAIGLLGLATWFSLTRGWSVAPWLLAALLFAHGWVHVMFVFPQPEPAAATAGSLAWPFDMGGSWLIGAGLDGGLVRSVGRGLMAAVAIGFALAALSTVGLVVPAGWWAGLVVASSVGSRVLLSMFFSPALLLGYAVDVGLLWLVFGSAWSPTAIPVG